MLSIIIPAYNATAFIDECIASLKEPCEILIGVDGCNKTLEHVKGLHLTGARLFYFPKNVGPFVVKNTLSDLASHNKLLFFDSDDVMAEGTISKVDGLLDVIPYVKLNYVNFYNIKHPIEHVMNDAVIGIQRNVFNELNGFIDWKCGADTEFSNRLIHNKIRHSLMDDVSYYRRLHGNNLTMHPDTNFASPIRKKYEQIIEMKTKTKQWPNPISKIKADCYEVN